MRLIDADSLLKHLFVTESRTGGSVYAQAYEKGWDDALKAVMAYEPTVADAVEVVRCKDCVHKPYVVDVFHASYGDIPRLESNGKCPCINADDYFYSHMPDDDWFCANGERRAEE